MTGRICIETEKQFHSIEYEILDKEEKYEAFEKLKMTAKDFGANLEEDYFEVYVLLPSKMNQKGFGPT